MAGSGSARGSTESERPNNQMRVNVHESRDETRLAAGTMVVDSALPSGTASGPQVNVATFPRGERFVESTFIGQAVTLPQGNMGPRPPETPTYIAPRQNQSNYPYPMGPATLPQWVPPPDTPIDSPYSYAGSPVSPAQPATLPQGHTGPLPMSPPAQNTLPQDSNARSSFRSEKTLLQKLAERLKLRRRS